MNALAIPFAIFILSNAGIAAPAPVRQSPKPASAANTDLPVGFCYVKGEAVFVLKAGHTQPERWARGKNLSFPALSPSGSMLAFTLSTDSKTQLSGSRFIAVQEGPGSLPRVIYGTPNHHCYKPIWSPNGEMIMFNNLRDGKWGVSAINRDGSGYRDVISPEVQHGSIGGAFWASDGKSLYANDFEFLYLVDLNGKLIKKMAFKDMSLEVSSSGASFSLSPDGKNLLLAIAMDLPDMDEFESPVEVLFSLDLDTGKTTRLSPKGVLARNPVWLPDGKSFLFFGEGKLKEGIYRMEIESNLPRMVIPRGSDPSLAAK